MVTALGLSAFGDAAIVFSFPVGGAAFLTVQFIHIVCFTRNGDLSQKNKVLLLFLAAYLIFGLLVLVPRAAEFSIPVGIYWAAICLMTMAASNYRGSRLVLLGAMLFLISDTIFVVNMFWVSFDAAIALLLGTYYLGQILIVSGVVSTHRDQARDSRAVYVS